MLTTSPTSRRHRGVELPERAVRLAQHPLRELEARRVGQQVGLRLHADPQPVLAQQPARIGVVGRDARLPVRIDVGGLGRPAAASRARSRRRCASSAAALLVKVSPSTCSGRTWPVATSQTTRAAITEVLPEPAPATMTPGSSGAVAAASCSSVKSMPRSARSTSGRSRVRLVDVTGHESIRPSGWAGQDER